MWIEIKDPKVYPLLENLEAMDLIKIEPKPKKEGLFSDRLAGKLSKGTARALNNYVTESRKEWERDNF